MPQERLETSVNRFWLATCGYNNQWRGAALADTPWNGFTQERDILVSTLWVRDILPIQDPATGKARRFVQMGVYRTDWNSTLRSKARSALANVETAFREKRRFVGFEVEPKPGIKEAKVKHFYLDRVYELNWIPSRSNDHDWIERAFVDAGMGVPAAAGNSAGFYFELVPLKGPVPGATREVPLAAAIAPTSSVKETEPADVEHSQPDPDEVIIEGLRGGWGGGESEHHRLLKEYVAANPARFGAPADAQAIQEFLLRSGDCIDVVFETDRAWIAIEVKSKVSDLVAGDYERGIFQVIKYRAVLQAQAAWDNPASPRKVRVLLALQGRLPEHLREKAQRFSCELVEGVDPPPSTSAVRTSPKGATPGAAPAGPTPATGTSAILERGIKTANFGPPPV